jgi:hypothetical protein
MQNEADLRIRTLAAGAFEFRPVGRAEAPRTRLRNWQTLSHLQGGFRQCGEFSNFEAHAPPIGVFWRGEIASSLN